MTNAIVLNETSNLVMPSHYMELDMEEMSYVDGGDFFIGISLSASFCIALTQYVPLSVKTGGIDLGTLGSIAMSNPIISSIVTPILTGVKAALAAIPIIGLIAIGVLVAATLTILGTALYAGSHGKGFKFGFEITTGWFGIPTGANFICGMQ